MDEREEHIERLKQSIAAAKRLKAELQQNIADSEKILREIKALARKKPMSNESN
jgi:F0F1-type ATP synthase membrane subunit b/b'